MGDKTLISWTDSTWNPIVGCSIVSPACTNCYAMAQAARIERMQPGGHYAGTTKIVNGKPVWTGVLKQSPEHILLQPLRWKRPRRIFVNSMSDLFHESVPDEWIDRVFAIMGLAPQHTFQILTKRPKRMQAYFAERMRPASDRIGTIAYLISCRFCIAGITPAWPLPNVWLGVTAEDQTRADERIPLLLETPAAKRFVSAEPLLGPLDLSKWLFAAPEGGVDFAYSRSQLLDQAIVGGESGPGARPMHPQWARDLRDQCRAAGTAFFFKQWGEWAPSDAIPRGQPIRASAHGVLSRDGRWRLDSDIADPPEHVFMFRLGKRAAGDLLDWIEHKEFPG